MAQRMSSADARRLLQLRRELVQMQMMHQQTAEIAEIQRADLMSTIEGVAALEVGNLKLRQSLLLALRTTSSEAFRARCSLATGRGALLSPGAATERSLQNASVPQGPFASSFPDRDPTHSPSSLVVRPSPPGGAKSEAHSPQEGVTAVAARAGLESDRGSEQAEEGQKAETISRCAPKQPRDDSHFVWPENATTVLVRNVPPRGSIEALIKAFPPDGSYDLVHLSFNIKTRRASSFATINFTSAALAAAFRDRFHGQLLPHSTRSKDPLIIMPAKVQGLEANLTFLLEEKGVAEMRNAALLPRLYLAGAAAARLVATGPRCIQQPDEPGQPHRLDFREVLEMLNNADEI